MVAAVALLALALLVSVKESYAHGGIEIWSFLNEFAFDAPLAALIVLSAERWSARPSRPRVWASRAATLQMLAALAMALHVADGRPLGDACFAFLRKGSMPFGLALLIWAWSLPQRSDGNRSAFNLIALAAVAAIAAAIIPAANWYLIEIHEVTIFLWQTVTPTALGLLVLASVGRLRGQNGYIAVIAVLAWTLRQAVGVASLNDDAWSLVWFSTTPVALDGLLLLVVYESNLAAATPSDLPAEAAGRG